MIDDNKKQLASDPVRIMFGKQEFFSCLPKLKKYSSNLYLVIGYTCHSRHLSTNRVVGELSKNIE